MSAMYVAQSGGICVTAKTHADAEGLLKAILPAIVEPISVEIIAWEDDDPPTPSPIGGQP